MTELRELIATELEMSIAAASFAGWPNGTVKIADAILAALDAAGLVVVPMEPTSAMYRAVDFQINRGHTDLDDTWAGMIAASPYAKKEGA